MPIKVENQASVQVTTDLEKLIQSVFDAVPKEHTRGISKVVIVDRIQEKAIAREMREKLPCLYHPKVMGMPAWFEIALANFVEQKGLIKRLASRLNLKTNLAGATLSLIGQHYHFTLSHGLKPNQREKAVRSYIEKYFTVWRDLNSGWRGRVFKPIYPYLDRFGKWMSTHYQQQLRKQQSQAKPSK